MRKAKRSVINRYPFIRRFSLAISLQPDLENAVKISFLPSSPESLVELNQ
jgi:hypothetical protein